VVSGPVFGVSLSTALFVEVGEYYVPEIWAGSRKTPIYDRVVEGRNNRSARSMVYGAAPARDADLSFCEQLRNTAAQRIRKRGGQSSSAGAR